MRMMCARPVIRPATCYTGADLRHLRPHKPAGFIATIRGGRERSAITWRRGSTPMSAMDKQPNRRARSPRTNSAHHHPLYRVVLPRVCQFVEVVNRALCLRRHAACLYTAVQGRKLNSVPSHAHHPGRNVKTLSNRSGIFINEAGAIVNFKSGAKSGCQTQRRCN